MVETTWCLVSCEACEISFFSLGTKRVPPSPSPFSSPSVLSIRHLQRLSKGTYRGDARRVLSGLSMTKKKVTDPALRALRYYRTLVESDKAKEKDKYSAFCKASDNYIITVITPADISSAAYLAKEGWTGLVDVGGSKRLRTLAIMNGLEILGISTPSASKNSELKDDFFEGEDVKDVEAEASSLKLTARSRQLFAYNLPYCIKRADVEKFFVDDGEVVDVRFAVDENGTFLGYGHVQFATFEAAEKAALTKQGKLIMGRALLLKEAHKDVPIQEPRLEAHQQGTYNCSTCNTSFSTVQALYNHMPTHRDQNNMQQDDDRKGKRVYNGK